MVANDERLLVVARRNDDGLKMLPVQHAGLDDGTRMQEVLSNTQAAIVDGMLPSESLPVVGAQIWRVEKI